ncbi:FAD-dependent monooxygenase [Pseudonocardia sp. CA-107938]|uniref:FAD-dependent monooxygenase n=1 Tax=Pseudonocardia sp. CA-107938 TaxID=3240021 RepID=UPI003D8CA191
MPAVASVAVVGGGVAGLAAAILLAEAGVAVDLVEISPEIGAVGSGITLQGNALRVLRRLGVWDRVAELGCAFDVLGLRTADGTVLAEIPDARTGGSDLPATVGMGRPDLARLLADRAAVLGVKIRTGTVPTALVQHTDGVELTCSDGSRARHDLLIGADGVRSWTRTALGVQLTTRPLGMGIWRAFGSRPASVTRTDLVYDGPAFIAGYCPTGPDTLYAYLVEAAQDRSGLTPEQRLSTMRELATAYHGPWDEIRDSLTDPRRVNYTWFETHLLDGPWHRGRVVLIGDATHCCPPTLAQGAAMAMEDAVVLAELLSAADTLDEQLWAAFTARRLERVRAVVDASVQLCDWLLAHEQADVPGLMRRIAALVTEAP